MVPSPQSERTGILAAAPNPAIESEQFELEMLDCGPGYSYGAADTLCACFRCYCGSGCLCGCIASDVES